ncbi:MAG TPA: type II toxin-antitoxin system VapC family toxin [Burkholderiales bacterium]|nr:type II toxin-antitoxin system VapC family toxin [Burkholderiales bacterium]
MILYLDTSAYVRIYIREPDHDQIWAAAQDASQITSHLIAYAEMRAALARMQRMGRLAEAEVARIRKTFELDWRRTLQIIPTEAMVRRAGDLAERFGLRGYDSVHLAAAESLQVDHDADFLHFASFDHHLNQSARVLGLCLLA